MFAGRLGDRHGHRRMFALGMLGFGAASAGIAVAPDIGWVIGLRALQGPSAPCCNRRRSACCGPRIRRSVWACRSRCAPARSPWRPRRVPWSAALWSPRSGGRPSSSSMSPRSGHGRARRMRPRPGATALVRPPLDLLGAALLATALMCLVYALTAGADSGRPVMSAPALLGSAVAALMFVRHERRTTGPLLPRTSSAGRGWAPRSRCSWPRRRRCWERCSSAVTSCRTSWASTPCGPRCEPCRDLWRWCRRRPRRPSSCAAAVRAAPPDRGGAPGRGRTPSVPALAGIAGPLDGNGIPAGGCRIRHGDGDGDGGGRTRGVRHLGRGGRRSAADRAEHRAHGGRRRCRHADDVHERGVRAHLAALACVSLLGVPPALRLPGRSETPVGTGGGSPAAG